MSRYFVDTLALESEGSAVVVEPQPGNGFFFDTVSPGLIHLSIQRLPLNDHLHIDLLCRYRAGENEHNSRLDFIR